MIAEVMKMREEEKKQPSQKFFKKRWVYPAIYLASAAIIITAILWYQSAGTDIAEEPNEYGYEDDVPTSDQFDRPAVEVNRSLENIAMPVSNPEEAIIEKGFYDETASTQEQEAALVFYNNTYQPNTGLDISMDGKEFDVVASLSGTVTKVQEDSLLGNVIEVEHDQGVVTRYSSVKDFAVQVGDSVEQGQTLAQANKSLLNEEAGVHVHFEIRKDNVAVNPIDYVNKSLASLKDADLKKSHDEDASDQSVIGESQSSDDQAAEEETTSEENTNSSEEETNSSDEEESADEQSSSTPNTEEDSNENE